MLSLKVIQTPSNHAFFHGKEFFKRKSASLVVSCKPGDSNPNNPPPQGDTRKQELLAQIAMLQAQKLRLTDYLDERSEYLTQFAEEANAEIDQIGENAFKELDEAGSRVSPFYFLFFIFIFTFSLVSNSPVLFRCVKPVVFFFFF